MGKVYSGIWFWGWAEVFAKARFELSPCVLSVLGSVLDEHSGEELEARPGEKLEARPGEKLKARPAKSSKRAQRKRGA
jgi:hypothetical protein